MTGSFRWTAAIILSFSLVACGDDDGGSVPAAETPSLAAALDEAGNDAVSLCLLAQDNPGAPEAETARERVAAIHAPAAERYRATVEELRLAPPMREALDAIFVRGATDPCKRHLTIHVDRRLEGAAAFSEYPMMPIDPATGQARPATSTWGQLVEHTPTWPSGEQVSEPIVERLRAVDAEWFNPMYSAYEPSRDSAHLILTYTVTTANPLSAGGIVYVGLGLMVSATLFVPAVADMPSLTREVSLGFIGLPDTFSVSFRAPVNQPDAVPPPLNVVDQEIRELTRVMSSSLVHRLGLDPPDPQLAPFAGRYSLEGEAESDGCAGEIVLAAQHLAVDAIEHTATADVVDRTYGVRVEDGALVAEGHFESSTLCAGTQLAETWRMTRGDDGVLSGALDSTWAAPPDCAETCTVRFALTATPIEPDED